MTIHTAVPWPVAEVGILTLHPAARVPPGVHAVRRIEGPHRVPWLVLPEDEWHHGNVIGADVMEDEDSNVRVLRRVA